MFASAPANALADRTAVGSACIGDLGRAEGFRRAPVHGYTRKDLAALLAHHPGNIKRLERQAAVLAAGRTSKNQRVLHYSLGAVVEFLAASDYRVDLASAIRLGFPLTALPSSRFGQASRGDWLTLASEHVQACQAKWAAWQRSQRKEANALPVSQHAALDQAVTLALLCLLEATPAKSRVAELAHAAGRSGRQMDSLVHEAAMRLHDQLHTSQGQLLFAALLTPKTPAR